MGTFVGCCHGYCCQEVFAVLAWGLGTMLAFGASYLYHRFEWSAGVEVSIEL